MAYKTLAKRPADEYALIKRDEAEKDLIFCGFIVSECPLKSDTKRVIKEFLDSNHMVKMITGDNQLTASYIGKELKFGGAESNPLFAKVLSNNKIEWTDIDDQLVQSTNSHE